MKGEEQTGSGALLFELQYIQTLAKKPASADAVSHMRASLRRITKHLEELEAIIDRKKTRTKIDATMGRTVRHDTIAHAILIDGAGLRDAGAMIGVTGTRARIMLHQFCRGRNKNAYDRLCVKPPSSTAEMQIPGLPKISRLRDLAAEFLWLT